MLGYVPERAPQVVLKRAYWLNQPTRLGRTSLAFGRKESIVTTMQHRSHEFGGYRIAASSRLVAMAILLMVLTGAEPLLMGQDATSPMAKVEQVDSTVPAEQEKPFYADLDERIDSAVKPAADFWEGLVLTPLPYSGALLNRVFGAEFKSDVPAVLALLIFGAAYFTLYFLFPNIRYFPIALKTVAGKYDHIERHTAEKSEVNVISGDVKRTAADEGKHGEVSHFQALATAVSGTVGLGNIAGVAVAIGIGGPGATFWMIVCGFLGMSTKFVECTLGVTYRDVDANGVVHGGPMYYLWKGFTELGLAPIGKVLAVVFAVLCVGASFGGGNAFQSNQATKQIVEILELQSGSAGFLIGVILAVITGIVIIGGIKSIAKVTEMIVPFMAILYIVACLVVILTNIQHFPTAISLIFSEAFTPRAGLGGIVAVILTGFQRAAFSNEAGAGSAAIAHSAVKTRYPASEGLVALLEPFIDTVVICTMTALVIVFFNLTNADIQGQSLTLKDEANRAKVMATLESDTVNKDQVLVLGLKDEAGLVLLKNGKGGLNGVGLTSAAFGHAVSWFPYVLTVAIVLFAFSTMISWSYYGLQSWKFLFGRSQAADISFKILFLLFVVIGASAKLDSVIKFSDAMILALVFPNMVGLFVLAPRVGREVGKYLNAIRSGANKS
jgi:AGCS family alanine or glycine:cation symporter